MTVSIKADPRNKTVEIGISRAVFRHRAGIREALYDLGGITKRDLRQSLTRNGKTGRVYLFRGEAYRASAAGQAPSLRSGALRDSVDYIVRGSQEMEFGDQVQYGKFLEDGTRNMKARPHVNPVAQRNARELVNRLGMRVGEKIFR